MSRSILAILVGYLVFGVFAFALIRLAGAAALAPRRALLLMAAAVARGGAFRLRSQG